MRSERRELLHRAVDGAVQVGGELGAHGVAHLLLGSGPQRQGALEQGAASRGTLPITLYLLDPLHRPGDRKQIAAEARNAIAAKLGLTSHDHSPIGEAE